MAHPEKIDAVIVGGGMAGFLMAAKLASAGKKVVVLEQGPAWKPDDMISSGIWGRRMKWSGAPVDMAGDSTPSYTYDTGWGLGGAGKHHFAQWPRLKPEDFRTHSLYGRSVDWPFDYDALRPYYDRVQKEVGISGDHVKEVWRPAGEPYPMPPVQVFPHAEAVAKGFAALGMRTAPMPLAITSVEYQGRPACIYDGWCESGCPIGALGNSFATYLPVAVKAGAVIRTGVTVTRVLTDKKGARASGVEYYDAQHRRHVQMASVVVLSANPIQNARLLLNSAGPGDDQGLANSSGLVGLNLLSHHSIGASGLFDADLQTYMGVTGSSMISQEGYHKDRGAGKPFGSYTWAFGSARKPAGTAGFDPGLFGDDLHKFIKTRAKGMTSVVAIGEQLPTADNRVTLTGEKDAFGLPTARLTNNLAPELKALLGLMRDEGERIMKAAGAKDVHAGRPGWQHLGGGTRMGTAADNSVCDGFGLTHDVPNLVMAGCGVFPTEGAAHPTFTMHAVTLRTSDHVIEHWGGITG